MSSSCIRWAKHHLDGFNALLSRQLSSVQRGTSVWQKCLDIVHDHVALLVEVGVDFTDLVARGLEENGEGSLDGPRTSTDPGIHAVVDCEILNADAELATLIWNLLYDYV
jgi:hypothetical protein